MTARILEPSQANLDYCQELLQKGQLVALPTETVYGLAGHALDGQAVTAIYASKHRPTFDPLIVHVAVALDQPRLPQLRHLIDLEQLSLPALRRAEALLQAFWPGPLTLVLPRQLQVPELTSGGLSTLAVRMPAHPVALALLRQSGMPLAAPSANRFGRISPTCAADVLAELGDQIPVILDGGPCAVGVESTVLRVSVDGDLTLLRFGAIGRAQLAAIAGYPVQLVSSPTMASPGMLASHYAPTKPLTLLDRPVDSVDLPTLQRLGLPPVTQRIGVLLQSGDAATVQALLSQRTGLEVQAISLSANGDAATIAQHLFAGLRALDASAAQWLLAEPCNGAQGLEHAIADRLKRASTRA